MVKILFYGGCHALVLRDYLQAAFPDVFDCSLLINFELVGSGRPFPYDSLDRFDFVVYSPIENRGEYNTSHLHDFCRTRRVQTICFPWIEWHGYCPGASKGLFKGRHQWHFPRLIERAASFEGDFDAFCRESIDAFPDDDEIDGVLESSTARVRDAEARHAMPVTVSDFILEHYAETRLFLISDHPCRAIYLDLLTQILDLIGITRRDTSVHLATLPSKEPQWRWRTPIFPRVVQRLGLRFEDPGWLDDDLVPGGELSLRTYLGLYFHRDGVILGPKGSASLFAPVADGGRGYRSMVGETTRLFARPLDCESLGSHDEYMLLQTLSGDGSALSPRQRFAIDPEEWRATWAF